MVDRHHLDQGRLTLNLEPHCLNDLLEEVSELLQL
jgi:hypothetical protein